MTRTARTRVLLLVLRASLAPLPAFAQSRKTAPATESLPAWEQLTPAQRELLIAPLRDRWNRDPDQRPRMLDHAKRWQSMPPGERDRARRGMQRWEGMSPEQRDQARALFEAMKGMDKEGRKAFLAQWKAMTPQQRKQWMDAHPAPPHRHGPPDRD